MILDEIVLQDFGIYGGRQQIVLTPESADKPIILFGGLNGGGKTTLLDALQLCFFGNVAKCAARADLPYEEYLRRSVHHQSSSGDAAIEVAFRHTVDGEDQSWRLIRSWTAKDNVRERFQVIRDGELDRAASEQWASQVEDFIPERIAHLFLFDGEKVEAYADLDQAPALIRTAVQNLLGLDLVERLGGDLIAIERRRKIEMKSPAEAEAVAALRDDLHGKVAERARLVRDRASTQVELDGLSRTARELDDRFQREGGNLFEDRGRLEAELAIALRGAEAIGRSLRDLAAGAAPLALVADQLREVQAIGVREEHAFRCAQTADVVAEEFAALLALPALKERDEALTLAVQAHAEQRLSRLRSEAGRPRHLFLDDSARAMIDSLLGGGLENDVRAVRDLTAQERQIAESIARFRGLLAAVPSEASIAELINARETARMELQVAEIEQQRRDAEIARCDREIAALRDRESAMLDTVARAQFEEEDVSRLLDHSARVRKTLEAFRSAVLARHVGRIEEFVLDSFRQLVRKDELVTSLKIDPGTFVLELRDGAGRVLTAERMSAGERQLLAIAIIWGLARASGRPLPTVIDTPLGRLDAEHRLRLVTRYFPQASHQVILLSTDEEITRHYQSELWPYVGRSYQLRFDESEDRTTVEPGYFQAQEAA